MVLTLFTFAWSMVFRVDNLSVMFKKCLQECGGGGGKRYVRSTRKCGNASGKRTAKGKKEESEEEEP